MPGTAFQFIGQLLEAGWLSLLDYLAAHVILCLLPAFFIAGAISALIPKDTVTRYLGPHASRWVSYPAAAAGGFVLAVCSCTILPLFAGIWKRGAGLGPAITFLFVGPAVNILAIAYTGAAIGMDIAIARIILSVGFGIGIGLIMALIFKAEVSTPDSALFEGQAQIRPAVWLFFGLAVTILIAGTLKVDILTRTYFSLLVPLDLPPVVSNLLTTTHLSLQGAVIILMLAIIAWCAWQGFENVLEKVTPWTGFALGAVAITLVIAAPTISEGNSILVECTGRSIAVTGLLAVLGAAAWKGLSQDELASWLWETWRFVKQIFPLLIAGVFLAGVIKEIIPEVWVRSLAGQNTLLANLVGVIFGVFMYFPTLVEVPIARMFLDLGMHRGPLLAYLIADPGLSVQSILVTNRILGRSKTGVYVVLVAIFSTLAGYLFGLAMAFL